MTFEEITSGLRKLLLDNNYNPATIRFYEREWNKIQSFLAGTYGDSMFDMERGLAYLENKYSIQTKYNDGTLSQQRVQLLRVVHMLEDAHGFRHSKAMHMLAAGINIVYIRDFLGHEDISTTMIYSRADNRLKNEAINKLAPKVAGDVHLQDWTKDQDLLSFLNSFK